MTIPPSADRDPAILDDIRQLTTELSDARTRSILQSVIDAVALNPQPLPPATGDILRSVLDAVALNPQPLPPEPPDHVALNPQPLPPDPPPDISARPEF